VRLFRWNQKKQRFDKEPVHAAKLPFVFSNRLHVENIYFNF